MGWKTRQEALDELEDAFGRALNAAHEGFGMAQDGSSLDCDEIRDEILGDAEERFKMFMKVLRAEGE